ncbi:MAG: HD domain-containing protein [Clostridia bacterium]|nr:HD domain-containing protein [Clostridia bacterium]
MLYAQHGGEVPMRTATKWYLGIVSALGMALGLAAAWRFFVSRPGAWTPQFVGVFLTLALICWLCCCLPLYVREDCTVDLSFLSVLASVLLLGPEAAVVINLITYPFVVLPSPDGKTRCHVLNTAPYKTFFNMANHNISYLVGGFAYYALGGTPGDISLPGILLPALLFIVLAMLSNVIVLVGYFSLERLAKFYPAVFQIFWGLVPSIALATPIGYFMAMLYGMPSGVWLAILFILPLLLARYSFKLYLDVQRNQARMVRSLMAALETKDTYTEGHSMRVDRYAGMIARRLGLSEAQIQTLELAATFHDIGKIGVPDAILQKPGPLTQEERKVIQLHPQAGVRILEHIDGYDKIIPLVLHHHEFYDGRGYPSGTKADEISLDTYILSAADAFDAITSDRPYRKGRSPQEAALILRTEAGRQFHPKVALTVAEMAEEGLLDRLAAEA